MVFKCRFEQLFILIHLKETSIETVKLTSHIQRNLVTSSITKKLEKQGIKRIQSTIYFQRDKLICFSQKFNV
jgi:hypothetical protein